jgi:hypothetical protein
MLLDILHKKETERTPEVQFNAASGELKIEGTSIPEDTLSFYEPIFEWLDNYLKNPAASTILTINLKFFNTSSSKCLFTIFGKMEALHYSGKNAKIIWCYKLEDTDMYESGQDFKNLLKVPFNIERC